MPSKKKSRGDIERLERENTRLRGDLLAIGRRVSHDLRTSLGGVSVSLELLKETLGKDETAAEAFRSLSQSMDELSRLIKSFSVLAKATANPPAMERVAMGEIVWGARQQLERQCAARGATVTAPDTWPEVAGVPGWLEFIWWNFLANALRHGGLEIQLGWSPEKDGYRFWIHDNGKGVAGQGRGLLFQPFDSLHRPDSTRGLGLSVVQRLVELQDGQCGYEEDGAVGPRFYFTLKKSTEDEK